jgi:hypothetical protein
MIWATPLLLVAYVGICEYRAPSPWQACDNRWNVALGVLVPSPVAPLAHNLMARMGPLQRRRRSDATPEQTP